MNIDSENLKKILQQTKFSSMLKILNTGLERWVRWLRVLPAFVEDPGSILGSHMETQNHP